MTVTPSQSSSSLTLARMWLGGGGSAGGTGAALLPQIQVMESGPQGCPHLLKISSSEVKFLGGSCALCRAGSEVLCLPGRPSWGGLGPAVLTVGPKREGLPVLAPVWAAPASEPHRPAGHCLFLNKGSQEGETCALPYPWVQFSGL